MHPDIENALRQIEVNGSHEAATMLRHHIERLHKAAGDVLADADDAAQRNTQYKAGVVPVTWVSLNKLRRVLGGF